MPDYSPRDWYWRVASNPTQYWSSKDKAYVASVPAGYGFTRIGTEALLWEVLADFDVALLPTNIPAADDYRRDRLLDKADLVQFEIDFRHENRIRALEGLGAVTRTQFRTAVKALL